MMVCPSLIVTPDRMCYNVEAQKRARPEAATNSRRTLTNSTNGTRTMAVPHSNSHLIHPTTHKFPRMVRS